MNKFILSLLILLFSIQIFGQKKSTYRLFGHVLDDNKEALPYVAVAVFSAKDSSYVKGAATEMNGKFSIQLPSGKYYAKISFLSFKDKTMPNIIVTDSDVDLSKIQLEPSVKNLEEFQVVEEKALMELDLDKRVYNVDKDVTNQGADAAEVLDNVPSVAVDVDGNVSLRGSENVRILINGKPSGMVGISTSEALKQLQGNQIEKIEVITNPSSRYDAEGEVGIINIVLKKDKREGINGSVNANFGYPNNYGGGFNITIKRKKFSVFTGYGVTFRDSPGSNTSSQNFTYPDTSFSYNSVSKTERFSFDNNFRLGTEIFVNDYNTITISGNTSFGDGDNTTDLTYSDFNELDVATQTVNRNEEEDKDRLSYDVNFNYRKTFKKKDRLFTIDFSHSDRTDNENSIITQTNDVVVAENLEQRVFNNEGGQNYVFQTDYIHPIKKGKLETGLKQTIRKIDDDYAVEQFNSSNSEWEFIPGFVNFVLFEENVSAAYIMYGNKMKKFSYQLGVRAEFTELKTELVTTKEINNRDYFNFFPTTHLNYEIKKGTSFQLSYSRRIQRPRHWWLLPFFSFTDSRSNFSGNPNLNPEFTDSYEVGHLKNWDKASLLASVYYRYTTNNITRITTSDSTGITQRKPINLGVKDAYGVEFSGSYDLKKWWSLRGSFNFYREIIEGEYLDVQYGSDAYVWTTRLNSKWNIKKKVNLQASFNFRAPQQSPQGETLARYSLDTGFSFDILKGNGTVTFNVKDVFNSRRRRSVSYGENFTSESERQWRSRYFRINIAYRINQKKKRGGDRGYDDFNSDGEG
ncbi:MAG: outer membrane beta-barrel family protein [Vicingaceae bacterium]|nr:outer membrane beta-barrel family protein [Vicingaceae bacterium]